MDSDRSKPVLIVDDDAWFRSLVSNLLSSRGLTAVGVRSAKEASTFVATTEPLLAIVDYRLPEVDGVTWITQVREAGMDFPIVFLSGTWCDEKTFNRVRNVLRVSLILRKPIVPALFMQQLEGLLPADFATPLPGYSFNLSGDSSKDLGNTAAPSAPAESEASVSGMPSPEELEQIRQESLKELAIVKANYAKQLASAWEELSKAVSLAQQEPDNLLLVNDAKDRAHKIRGTAGSMGFEQQGLAAGKIEDLLLRFDPSDTTMLEILWTEIFRALVDGETAIRENLKEVAPTRTQSLTAAASKVLLLTTREYLKDSTAELSATAENALEFVSTQAELMQSLQRLRVEGVILDLSSVNEAEIFELTKEVRLIAGHKPLPFAFINTGTDKISAVDLLYAGCSQLINDPADKYAIELAVDKLVSIRQLEKPRVLTVDDDPVLTDFISSVLQGEGMHVQTLNKPIQIMETVEAFRPDLVLLDVMMPGLSGYDVCRILRESQRWHNLAVIFLTSKSDQNGRTAAFQAGANDFLSKPVLTKELTARVKAQLSQVSSSHGTMQIDPLTKMVTSQDFIRIAQARIEEAKAQSAIMSLCLLSIDDFLQILINQGVSAGQELLSILGKLIRCRFKAEDLRGRFGEDGFALAFLGEGQNSVGEAMARLQEEFAQVKLRGSSLLNVKVRFSAGIAEYPTDETNLSALLNMANERLLVGKNQFNAIISA